MWLEKATLGMVKWPFPTCEKRPANNDSHWKQRAQLLNLFSCLCVKMSVPNPSYPEDVLCVPRSPIEEEKSREAVSMITTLAKIFGVIKGLANCSGEICMTSRLGLKQLWISLSKSQYKATQCTAQKFHTCSYRIYSGLCAETERGFFSKSGVKLVLDVMEINFTWGFGFVRN